jgi:PAS domain S-box-containing protein
LRHNAGEQAAAAKPGDEEAIFLFLKSALAQAIVIGHWTTGRIYYATEAAASLLGVRADLLHGMSALQFFANPDERLDAMRRLANGQNVVRAELRLRSFDGRDLNVLADLGRIAYQGEPSLILVLNDVTGYKRQQSQLMAASQAKSQFLAQMSHELRSPLNAILGFAEIIRDDSLSDAFRDRYPEYAGHIHRAGSHLLGLINDVLDLSKIEAGRMEFDRAEFDLKDLAEECLALMRPEAERRAIRMSAKQARAKIDTMALADPRRCRQVLINLLSNALKFTRPGGDVSLEIRALSCGRLAVAIADTGIGMTESQIALALEPFGQVPGSHTEHDSRGTGLGLPIVKSLIEAQGGTMTIESEPGQGTTITFSLPRAGDAQVMDKKTV